MIEFDRPAVGLPKHRHHLIEILQEFIWATKCQLPQAIKDIKLCSLSDIRVQLLHKEGNDCFEVPWEVFAAAFGDFSKSVDSLFEEGLLVDFGEGVVQILLEVLKEWEETLSNG